MTETPRTWTAEITIYERTSSFGPSETVAADLPNPRYTEGFMGVPDLLRDTTAAALHQAAEYVRAGLGGSASVTIFKTTKARGREADRSGGFAYRDGDRVITNR